MSHAAIMTVRSCCSSQYATLARLVDLPTPLTPMNTMVYGLPRCRAARASRRMSVERRGVRIRVNASVIA